jgi:hypothetical protein
VRADEKLTAFLELEAAIRDCSRYRFLVKKSANRPSIRVPQAVFASPIALLIAFGSPYHSRPNGSAKYVNVTVGIANSKSTTESGTTSNQPFWSLKPWQTPKSRQQW